MIGLGKRTNVYAQSVDDFNAPKTVWMALAVSFAIRLAESNEDFAFRAMIRAEWIALHDNGIVPQKPPKG